MKYDCIIVDTQLSNLHSVENVCRKFDISYTTTNETKDLLSAKSIILPGVGSFKNAMKNLESLDLRNRIKDFTLEDRPILGICLGMQLLMESSEEFGYTDGLGIIKGEVKKFSNKIVPSIPHVGWNKVFHQYGDKRFLGKSFQEDYFYFVHSFYVEPKDDLSFSCSTSFGEQNFCSSLGKNKIFATQFHPEKSGESGLGLCKNFFNLIK